MHLPHQDLGGAGRGETLTSRTGDPGGIAALEIIAAFEEAQAEGRGVVTVNGRMIENLHVDNARRILAVADAISALG